jgi:type IV fimbrial biogenesis protein FimT
MDRQRGFTLGEILATLGIAAITLAMAIPSLDVLARGNAEANAVNRLVASLHAARSEAITRNTRVTVCASRDLEGCAGEWHDGWIVFLDANGDHARTDGEMLLEQVTALDGLALHSVQFERSLSYAANGRIDVEAGAGTGEFAFCAPGDERAGKIVVVRASGLPRLSAAGRDGNAVPCAG